MTKGDTVDKINVIREIKNPDGKCRNNRQQLVKMDRTAIPSDSPSGQYFLQYHPIQNAHLLLLNQARDIVRYGPLAPYVSLEKEELNTNVPLCCMPDRFYNPAPSYQKSAFLAPSMSASDIDQNHQYCKPFTIVDSNPFPLGQNEWVRRPFLPFSTVSCHGYLNYDHLKSNICKTFTHSDIYRSSNNTQLSPAHLQYNNDVCCRRHPGKYLETVHPYKIAEDSPSSLLPIITPTTSNLNVINHSLDSRTSHNLSLTHDKRPTKNYANLSLVINRSDEPLNLIINSNQSSNPILALSSSSSSSPQISFPLSASTSTLSSSLAMNPTHPLSVSTLSQSACQSTPYLTLQNSFSHNSNRQNSPLVCKSNNNNNNNNDNNNRQCESSSSPTENYLVENDHNKLSNTKPRKSSDEKECHSSFHSKNNIDSFLKNDKPAEGNQCPSCDKRVHRIEILKDTINNQYRSFQTTRPNYERDFDCVDMLNRQRPNEHHQAVHQRHKHGCVPSSDSRTNEVQDNLRPSFESSAIEERIITGKTSRNSVENMNQRRKLKSHFLTQYQNESQSDHGLQNANVADAESNSINAINRSSNAGWQNMQGLPSSKNPSLLKIQNEGDSYTAQTELPRAKQSEKGASDSANTIEPPCATCAFSEVNIIENGNIQPSTQTLSKSASKSNSCGQNSIYPTFKVRPVKILVGASRNEDAINSHISFSKESFLKESRPSVSQPYLVHQAEHSTTENVRREAHENPVVSPPKDLDTPGESKLKASGGIFSRNHVSVISANKTTDCNKRVCCEPEEEECYYDLNLRDVVSRSSRIPTNPKEINKCSIDKRLSNSNKEMTKCSYQHVDVPYSSYSGRSCFMTKTPEEYVCNQNSSRKDKRSTEIKEIENKCRVDSHERLVHLSSRKTLERQKTDSISDNTETAYQSNQSPRDCSQLDCGDNQQELAFNQALSHDTAINDSRISPRDNFGYQSGTNREVNSLDTCKDGDTPFFETRTMDSSKKSKTDYFDDDNNGLGQSRNISSRLLQKGNTRPLINPEVTSESDTENSLTADCINEDNNLLVMNENSNDEISIHSLLTTNERSSSNSSDISAKTNVSLAQTNSPEDMNDSSNANPQCVYCEQIFSSTNSLQEHLKTHMVSTPYQCQHCSLGFVSKARLLRHVQLHVNAKPYKCEECANLFSTVTAFHRHLHSKKHGGKNLFKCNQCGLSFINENYVNLHYKTHTGEHPFQCEQCGNIFACKNNLKNHIMTHTGEKPYQCVHCAKRFVTNFSLKVHIRTHTKEYPYRCDICNKRFLCSSNMASHLRTHTGEKRHQCYKCGKFLSSWSGLQGHQRTHTKECPFSCSLCSKAFSSKFSLRIHQRIHSGENPHKCKYCDKCFSNSSNLQRHLRTHTGEKPYQCNYCSKTFCSSTYLKSHIRTHTGEKPHTCKFCGKGFSNTSCFKQHVKKHEK